MQDISSNDSTYKIPIHISQNVQIESSDNLLVVGAPKQESAEKILIPNLLSGTSSYLVIDPDGIICSELPATDFCEQKSKGASGGLFHAQPEGIAETKRIPVAGLLKGLLAVLQFTLLSPGYAIKIPNCPQSSGRSRYPSEDNGHSLSYL